MKIKIIILLLLSLSVIANSYAQSSISITTDNNSYEPGSLVTIRGNINPPAANQVVAIEIKDGNNQSVLIRTVQTDTSGSFELKFKTLSSASSGTYGIKGNVIVNGEKIMQSHQFLIGTSTSGGLGGNYIPIIIAVVAVIVVGVVIVKKWMDKHKEIIP